MKKPSFKFLSTIGIIIFCLIYAIPALIPNIKNLPFDMNPHKIRLGLDLQGGSQLLLQVDSQVALKEKLETLADDIRIQFEENNYPPVHLANLLKE